MNDENSNKKVFDLKLENIPAFLYRYKPLNDYAIDELKKAYVYLNSAEKFNDPFETIGMLSKGDFDKLINEAGDKFDWIKLQYNLSKMQKEMWEKSEKEMGIDNFLSKIYAEKCATLQQTVFNITEADIDFLSFISKSIIMTCFTDNYLSLPMWGHYANNHTGICVEYAFDREALATYPGFFPMRYTNDFSKIHKSMQQGYERAYLYILSRKNEAWKYEREWRYARLNPDSNVKGTHCKEFIVRAVYLGIKCNEKDKINKILEISRLHKFKVYQMIQTHYGLEPQLL